MIRINLLPGPRGAKAKPTYDVRAQLLLAIGILLITLASCAWYWTVLDTELDAKRAEKGEKEQQVAHLKSQVKQVQDFEQKKKLLEDKTKIIDQLEQSRVGPVRVLDYVSQSLEPLKVWLVKLAISGNAVELEGRAMTNDDVVEFVNNLRRTNYFSTITLQESRAAVDNKVNIYQFKLGLQLKG